MIVFDKEDKILKSVEFKRDTAALAYQLKNGETVPDRAEAAAALGSIRDDPQAVSALGDAVRDDPFWGVRVESLTALGRIGGPEAEKQVLVGAADSKPWVRDVAVFELRRFHDDITIPDKLNNIAAKDPAYRVRAAALGALASLKAPDAFETLSAAVKSNTPDDIGSRCRAARTRQARRPARSLNLDGMVETRKTDRQPRVGDRRRGRTRQDESRDNAGVGFLPK